MLTKTLSVLTILAIFNCEAFQQSDTGDEVYDAERQGRASNCGKIDPTRYKEMPKWTRKADNAYDDHGETLHNIIQVQPPACFEITEETRANVDAVRKALEDHEEVKMEVTDALLELSRNVEGIVVQKMEEEMVVVWDRIEGHFINVGMGTVSLIMLATPLAPLSAPFGIAGVVIGYLSLDESEVHAIYVRSKHVERIKKIQDDLFKELKKYTDSQEKVFETLNIKMEILTEGKEVKKNLKRIKKIVEEIEDESNVSFKEVFLFIEKAKAKYMSLSPEQKESLNINDLVEKAQELTSKVAPLVAGVTSKVGAEGAWAAAEGVIGDVGAIGDVVASGFKFFNFLQGINILFNGVFMANNSWKYYELRRMKGEEWNVEKIFKESKEFKKEEELRNLIMKIRDEIVKGY